MDDKEIIKQIEEWAYGLDHQCIIATTEYGIGYKEGVMSAKYIVKTILENRQELPTEGNRQD